MTSATMPRTVFGVAGRFSSGMGTLLGGVVLGYDLNAYSKGDLSGYRVGYRAGFFITSYVIGMEVGGLYGFGVALGLNGLDYVYDSFDQFRRTIIGGGVRK